MKAIVFWLVTLIVTFATLNSTAQSYILEINPKAYSNTRYGVSLDVNIFLSKIFGIGGTYYYNQRETTNYGGNYPNGFDGGNAYGLSLIATSNRQNKIRYYGHIKLLKVAFFDPLYPDAPVSNYGGMVGGGLMYGLGRSIAINGELNYFLGDNIHKDYSSTGILGYKGLCIEFGFVFKMIRRK